MGKVKLEGYVCERCRHKRVPLETTISEPKVCPKCKSLIGIRRENGE